MNNSSAAITGVTSFRRIISTLALLVLLPCLTSLINIDFAQSWKLHFFPVAIILASVVFGAAGGAIAGFSGSLYSALFLGNPYVLIGNTLFGLLTGLFFRKSGSIISAVLLAFACEIPWLVMSDYYLVHLPVTFILKLVVVLLLTNILWAVLINLNMKRIRKLFLC